MSLFSNPFDSRIRLHCSCGAHANQSEHDAAQTDTEALGSRAVEQAVVRALFPNDSVRRSFLSAVGAPTAIAAISSLFPLTAAKEAFAQAAGAPESAI